MNKVYTNKQSEMVTHAVKHGKWNVYHFQFKYIYINIYNGIIFPSLNPAKIFQFIFPMNRVNKKFGTWAESPA